eukprot:1453664-Pyramimonas_sp.AAC.1
MQVGAKALGAPAGARDKQPGIASVSKKTIEVDAPGGLRTVKLDLPGPPTAEPVFDGPRPSQPERLGE